MTVPGRGGAPKKEHVPTELGVCDVHGVQEFRVHKVGKSKTGKQRYRKRCPICHNDFNSGRWAPDL